MILDKDTPYIVEIEEFNDDERLHDKTLEAVLSHKGLNAQLEIKVIAPAIRSTEIEGNFAHKFFKTSDGLFLSLKEGK
jgi:hypothetical protein